jgi:hypothetical protein
MECGNYSAWIAEKNLNKLVKSKVKYPTSDL